MIIILTGLQIYENAKSSLNHAAAGFPQQHVPFLGQ